MVASGARVSGALSKAEERRPREHLDFPPVVRSLAAVMLFPFDEVLRGMIAAGQGIDALCLFLGLTRELLHDHLVRLGLATPHDRPLRKPGARGWSILDNIRLIAWRMAGVHPEIIGERLSRSAGAVRSKARRLGLRAPPRKLLHMPDPKTLCDPEPGFGWLQSAMPTTPESACGRVAGDISYRGSDKDTSFRLETEAATGDKIKFVFGGSIGQRQVPVFGVVGSTDRQPATPAPAKIERKAARVARPIAELVIPKTEAEVDFTADLTWIGRTRGRLTNKVAVWICGMLYLGGLHWAEAAKRVGMTPSAFRTFKTRAGIPVEVDRKKFSHIFDERMARATLAASGHKVKQCLSAVDGKGNWFWVARNDFGTRISPPKRKRDHTIEGRFNRVRILKSPEIRTGQTRIFAPFANGDGKNGCNRNSRSAAYA